MGRDHPACDGLNRAWGGKPMRLTQEILTVAEAAAADRAAIAAGTAGLVLMERAGQGVAAAIQARWSPRRTLVLCGPGGNGGDGYVVARALAAAGWPVAAAAFGDPARLSGDAAAAAKAWTGETRPLAEADFASVELVVDALFGAGLKRPLPAPV